MIMKIEVRSNSSILITNDISKANSSTDSTNDNNITSTSNTNTSNMTNIGRARKVVGCQPLAETERGG